MLKLRWFCLRSFCLRWLIADDGGDFCIVVATVAKSVILSCWIVRGAILDCVLVGDFVLSVLSDSKEAVAVVIFIFQ